MLRFATVDHEHNGSYPNSPYRLILGREMYLGTVNWKNHRAMLTVSRYKPSMITIAEVPCLPNTYSTARSR
jgi:hypothetical protein